MLGVTLKLLFSVLITELMDTKRRKIGSVRSQISLGSSRDPRCQYLTGCSDDFP